MINLRPALIVASFVCSTIFGMASSLHAEDYGLNDAAVQIYANDTVPRMDTTLYQRLGPNCPRSESKTITRWSIAWQNRGVRPWKQPNWRKDASSDELIGIACAIARTQARKMRSILENKGLGGNMERLAEFEGMTPAQIKERHGTRKYKDALRAWEMANFTYAVAKVMGVAVRK